MQRIPWDIVRNLKKVNWKNVWHIKKISREETMTEALAQLLREFEGKLTVIFQQMIEESENLKNEVKELHRNYEKLQDKKNMLAAENLKLKNGILHASESMRDFLKTIVAEANEGNAEASDVGQDVGKAEI